MRATAQIHGAFITGLFSVLAFAFALPWRARSGWPWPARALRPGLKESLTGTLVLFGAALGPVALVMLGHRRAIAG